MPSVKESLDTHPDRTEDFSSRYMDRVANLPELNRYPRDFVRTVFRLLEEHEFHYCLLHSNEETPKGLAEDLEIVLSPVDRARLPLVFDGLRKEGFSGVTVLRGVAGYGSSSIYHTDKILRLSQDLPIILEIVEYSERIEKILPKLDEMVEGGLITLEKVRVILYRPKK